MEQQTGFQQDNFMVCKLRKAIYGLKKAPRAWYERFSAFLGTLGFHTSKADSSPMVRSSSQSSCYILIYVDDIILMGSSTTEVQRIITLLNAQFALKDLGPLSYFLGIEVSYPTSGGLFLR